MSLCFSNQVVDSDRPEGSKFRLTGKGVDQEPKGIFRINENTGGVSVTRSLDREMFATYQVSTPRAPTLHAEPWRETIVFFPLSSLFLCFIKPGLVQLQVCLCGSWVALNPCGTTVGAPVLSVEPPRPVWDFGYWRPRIGVLGDLRGGQDP